MSKEVLKIHQIKKAFTGEKFRNSTFYCGQNEVIPLADIPAHDARPREGHCKRCLRALQLRKGHDYMIEKGLPLQKIRKY